MAGMPAGRALTASSRSSAGFGLCGQPPKLKPLAVDRLLDRCARELVGRIDFWPHHADGRPGPMLLRQLAAGRITREGAKPLPALGLEDVDAHRLVPFCARAFTILPEFQRRTNCRRTGGRGGPARSSLWRKINRPFSRS